MNKQMLKQVLIYRNTFIDSLKDVIADETNNLTDKSTVAEVIRYLCFNNFKTLEALDALDKE